MSRLLTNTEFFTYQGEVWMRHDGIQSRLTETSYDVIDELLDMISTFYPKAYDALCKELKGCALNTRYFRFRIVNRFLRCNFAQIDDIDDLSSDGTCSFEYVPCPLRGECRFEHIVCRPEFDHKLSAAEFPVLKLWFEGETEEDIADRLCLSPHTVHNHIRNAYKRTNVHSRSEFVKYSADNKIFQ